MYEEDRQTALAMYDKMFDDAEDEQELLHLLNSPTRQAVIIARAYNAKERKLSVQAQSGRGDADVAGAEIPEFVEVINEIHEDAINLNVIGPEVLKDQISFFGEEAEDPVFESASEPNFSFMDNTFSVPQQSPAPTVSEPAPAPAPVAVVESVPVEKAPAEAAEPPATEKPAEPAEPEVQPSTAEVPEVAPEKAVKPEAAPLADDNEFSLDLPAAKDEHEDTINAFMESFTLENDELTSLEKKAEDTPTKAVPEVPAVATEAESEKAEKPEEAVKPEKKEKEKKRKKEAPPVPAAEKTSFAAKEPPREGGVVVPLLILYLIIAIPLTALGIIILLIPALLFLAASVVVVVVGIKVISVAFGGFAVFSDVMVVLGASLVILAVGLLLFWIFIWFVGGAIAGLINGAIKLGGKICCRED